MEVINFSNTENDVTVKEFSYSQAKGDKSFYACIIRRETPETETGITWEVLKQTGSNTPEYFYTANYSVAEMDFKNFVLLAMSSDIFYNYTAERS